MRARFEHLWLWPLLLALAGPVAAADGEPAAEITDVTGIAQATSPDGRVRGLSEGDPLFVGDILTTAARSKVDLRFSDGTRFELGPDGRMTVNRYSYRADEAEDEIETSITKGIFRFVTGLIAKAKSENASVRMGVATIGIRGTHVVGEATETSARVILLETEGEPSPGAIEVFNQFGAVTIDQAGFGTEVPDEHSPPSPPRRMRLRTIDNLLKSLQAIQRMRVPRIRP